VPRSSWLLFPCLLRGQRCINRVQNVFNMLWPSGRHIQPKMRAFIDFMCQKSLLDKSK
jgi:hypothetical protein